MWSVKVKSENFTPDLVISALRSTAGVNSAAAIKLGCTAQTVRNYIARYPEIAQAREAIRQDNVDLAETKLLTAVKAGNMTAIIFYLKTQGKDRGYTERVEATGKQGAPIEFESKHNVDWSKVTAEMAQAILEASVKNGTDE